MTARVRRVIREPLKLQRLRRNYRQQQGVYRKTYLAAVNGRVLGTKLGHLWVHDAASADGSGNVTYNAPYQLPIKPGASIAHRPNWKVNVVTIEGDEFIESMDVNEMLRANFDPHQTNPLDPSLQFKLIENLQNLQAFPNGDETVRVMPSIYRKSDGTYDVFAAIDTDILTGNVPSADNQVVVCLWLKTDNTIEITVSSEELASTNLKLDPTTALTLINECAAAAPVGALGIWSFIIWDDTTAITGINKFHDLRGIVGSGIHSILDNLTATTAPTVNDDSDDGYSVGSRWFDVTNDKIYLCIDATVGAAIWIEIVGRTQIQTLTNKTISTSANTVGTGSESTKIISVADAVNAGTDRNILVSANSGASDNLIEITGLSVGESILVRATSGHTITVKHNDSGATVKIHLHGNADITLDEQNPLRLTLIATNVLAEDVQSSSGADADAIHDNVAGEINAVGAKTSPVVGDVLLIEDSEDSYNKKSIVLGSIAHIGININVRTTFNQASGTLTLVDDLPANAILRRVLVEVESAAGGGSPTLAIGISGDIDLYVDETENELQTTAIYLLEFEEELGATPDDIIATITADSQTFSGDIVITYGLP